MTGFAWAAGFFDGEGSSILVNQRPRCASPGSFVIQIGQKHREPLDTFAERVGVGKVLGPYEYRHARDGVMRRQFVYRASGRDAFRAVCGMWEWLSEIKKAQIKKCWLARAEYGKTK